MSRSRADIRYARALFLLTEEKGQSAAVNEDLKAVRNLAKASPDLGAFLTHPLLPAATQEATVKAVFGNRVNEATLNFLVMLSIRRRLRLFAGICECFEDLYLESKNILRISVVSAYELRKDQVEAIQVAMSKLYGKSVQASLTIDEKLLGGFLVLVRDTVHDFSVRGKLKALRLALGAGRAGE